MGSHSALRWALRMMRKAGLSLAVLVLIVAILLSPDSPTVSAQPSTTVTLAASGDTYLKGGTPNTNEGASTFVRVQQSGPNRALIRFSQSEIQAAVDGGILVSAKVRMTITDNGNNWGTTGRTVDVHRVLVDWTEGNGLNGEGATWNCPKDTNIANQAPDGPLWKDLGPPYKDGGSYLVTPISTITITNGMSGVVEWTVTADVAAFLADTSNYGWIIRKTDEGSSGRADFASKENGVTNNRPQLVITYTSPPISKIVFTTSPQTLTAGVPSAVMTIQTQDANGNPANVASDTTIALSSTSHSGKFSLSTSPWSDAVSLTISAGSNSVSFYYKDTIAGTPTITAAENPSEGWIDATQEETVNPSALASFTISDYPSSTSAGQNFGSNDVTVSAYDAYGSVKTDYTGQVYFTSTDPQAVLPCTSGSKYTFTTGAGGDNGVHAFAGTGFTLKTPGSQTISVTDGTVSLTSSPITVSPAALSITITSDPTSSGFVKVDGSSIITPQAFMWVVGSTHDLEALSPVSGGSGIQYVWTSWSDGGGQSHTYTTPLSPQTVTASYGTREEIVTSTGSGTAYFDTKTGVLSDLSAVSEASLPAAGRPNLIFPHGFFSFTITDLTPGGTASVTITLPSAVPVGTQYWKYGPTPTDPTNHWYQLPMGDDDGDNMITITLVDGGLGDDDLTLDGVIIDQGGPANPPAPVGAPVGGYVAPVNKLAILAPSLVLFGVTAAVTALASAPRRHVH